MNNCLADIVMPCPPDLFIANYFIIHCSFFIIHFIYACRACAAYSLQKYK